MTNQTHKTYRLKRDLVKYANNYNKPLKKKIISTSLKTSKLRKEIEKKAGIVFENAGESNVLTNNISFVTRKEILATYKTQKWDMKELKNGKRWLKVVSMRPLYRKRLIARFGTKKAGKLLKELRKIRTSARRRSRK